MATGLFNLKQVNQAISQGAWSGYIAPRWVEYLVVAGGGGAAAGGGGGGGLLTGIVTVAAGTSYTVTVGAGGASQTGNGVNGASSVFGNISASGGGGGGWRSTALSGGSGGGSAADNSTVGGQGISGQGFAGGNNPVGYSRGAGGGGAGTKGFDSISSSVDTPGGAGIGSAISGTVVVYSAGGAGTTTAVSGSANTGNGAVGSYGSPSGAGGSGIVVVRYPGNVQFYTGGTVTYSNGYIVHNFTANGTLAPTTPTVVSEYQISRSLRFNSADSAYLNRTPATTTNRTTWTWSGWVKRASFGSSQVLFGAGPDASNYTIFYFSGTVSENLEIYNYTGGVNNGYVYTTSVFRDPSAWYHVVLAVDTTQATSADRTKIYVNGVLQPITISVTFASGLNTWVNTNNNHRLGSTPATGALYGGYMTEVNLIDGQQLTPTSFGYVNPTTGIWSPAKYVGGYGTNGFYLNFSDNSNTTAATLGADYSGNGNNWTPNNFSVTAGAGNDSLVDSPTSYGTDTGVGGTVRGNYATFNPLIKVVSQPTLSNGNLLSTAPAGWSSAVGTIGVTSGKWYWEIVNGNSDAFVGICGDNATLGTDAPQSSTGTILYYGNTGNKRIDTVDTGYGSTFSTQTIGVALDVDGGTIVFYRDNVSQGSISLSSSTLNGRTIFPLSGVISTTATVNFGQRPFAYTAPSGFKALCTQNLPTPTIGATTATQAGKYYNAVLYTGNGSSQSVTGVGFQPDFVWVKERSSTSGNVLFDVIRGATKYLESNVTAAEGTDASTLTAFNSDGFSVGSSGAMNQSSQTYVGWNWKANGSGSTNTSGSITSTVSVNTTSGFSVVTYTGNGTNNATVGHGLGVTPSMMILKSRSGGTYDWRVYHSGLTAGYNIALNTTAAQFQGSSGNAGYISAVASTTFTLTQSGANVLDAVNASGSTYVAYCFAPIAGYSAFGSYTGNGSSDGPFVFTGFRPAYLMIKRTSSTGDWFVYNNKTSPANAVNLYLVANTSGAEGTYATLDFLSNGFKLRVSDAEVNGNGSTIIFMAFAENPFKTSLAR
jgi:hypothetical protein